MSFLYEKIYRYTRYKTYTCMADFLLTVYSANRRCPGPESDG